MEELDLLSQRYGVLPSSILKNSIIELQFDMLVANAGIEAQNKALAKANRSNKTRGK